MDDRAVSSNLAFIIASGILLASVSSVYTATTELADQGAVRAGEQVNLQGDARGLAQLLLNTEGLVFDGNGAIIWNATGAYNDQLVSLGLLEPNQSYLSFEKFKNLRTSAFAANASDGAINYEEAAAAVGYDFRNLGFHIRTEPTDLIKTDVLLGSDIKDDYLQVSYIGNFDPDESQVSPPPAPGAELVVGDVFCDVSPIDNELLRYNTTITNGGTAATQFTLVMDVYTDYAPGDNFDLEPKRARQGHTYIVNQGDSVNAWVDFEYAGAASQRPDCDTTDYVFVDIYDPNVQLRLVDAGAPTPVGTPSPVAAAGEFFAELDHKYRDITEEVVVRFNGGLVAKNDDITLSVHQGAGDGGTVLHTETKSAQINDNKWWFKFTPITKGMTAGEYTVVVEHEDGIKSSQQLLVASSVENYAPPPGNSGAAVSNSVDAEVSMVDEVMDRFCPFTYDDPSQGWSIHPESALHAVRCQFKSDPVIAGDSVADVYPAQSAALTELVSKLEHDSDTPRYDLVDVLVIGSDIPTNSLNSGSIKWPIKRWVEGGGTIIHFGSPDGTLNWMNPLFGIKEASSGSGVTSPDVNHPILSSPNSLAWDTFDTDGEGWDLPADLFTEVVVEGQVPVTAVSNPGKFGNGTIILTTWRPYDLDGDGTADFGAGLDLVSNFLMYGYADLYLDYGPPIPAGVPVVPTVQFASIYHPDLDAEISLTVTVYVFPYY